MIQFGCPKCSQVMSAQDDRAGSKTACPKCQQRLLIPHGIKPIIPASGTVLATPIPPATPVNDLPATTLYSGALPPTREDGAPRPAKRDGSGVYGALGACLILGIFLYGLGMIVTNAEESRNYSEFLMFAGSPAGVVLKAMGALVAIGAYVALLVVYAVRQISRD